ncbi:Heterokaryon incompatibility protein 6, OR allele [Teratosphaeria destructans]|uniref:Heterokaryon incompatibility protein 6, OR allele n=1 Tax=Teratosphaeria destructans TaxID=418781 RepID=A0A9W7SHJ7_9PEZI|nr:Heterokaryon incompatibility protein 6, OR allele [Teratosphaeria destructans]
MEHRPIDDIGEIKLLTLRCRKVHEQYHRQEIIDSNRMPACLLDSFPARFDRYDLFSETDSSGSRASWVASSPRYLALSYAWGEPRSRPKALVNGQHVEIPENLSRALETLETSDFAEKGLKFWTDAICIDQANLEERNRMVARMQDIYKHSQDVVVWLGAAANDSDMAMDFINDLAAAWRSDVTSAMQHLRNSLERVGDRLFPALASLIERPYWSRVWIIQELACGSANTPILCGTRITTWRNLLQIYSSLNTYNSDGERGLTRIFERALQTCEQSVRESHQYHMKYWEWNKCNDFSALQASFMLATQTSTLQLLLSRTRYASCSLPQDKVYGVLGLLPWAIARRIVVDYTLSYAKVYLQFTRACIEAEQSLEILQQSGSEDDGDLSNEGMPSWVPNLRLQQRTYTSSVERDYDAHTKASASYRWLPDDEQALVARCVLVDTIDGVTESLCETAVDPPSEDAVQSSTAANVYGDRDSASEALWRALMGDRDLSGQDAESENTCLLSGTLLQEGSMREVQRGDSAEKAAFFHDLQAFLVRNRAFRICGQALEEYFTRGREATAKPAGRSDASSSGNSESTFLNAVRRCREFVFARRLAHSTAGYVAVVPRKARVGDQIAVVLGCSTPVLFRSVRGSWKVVGSCYVQGIMDGAVIRGLRAGRLSAVDVTLH